MQRASVNQDAGFVVQYTTLRILLYPQKSTPYLEFSLEYMNIFVEEFT